MKRYDSVFTGKKGHQSSLHTNLMLHVQSHYVLTDKIRHLFAEELDRYLKGKVDFWTEDGGQYRTRHEY